MGREKSPGLKILWVWTIGTAAILVASVVRTRMHDMETMMNQEQAPPKQNQNVAASHSVVTDETVLPESDREIAKELK
ncbi:Basic leucine zipper/W2 domain protein [Hirschfeldia incana]|nr:Basic leucine zipper/W2 domain protein [Hirschfeldia incana]